MSNLGIDIIGSVCIVIVTFIASSLLGYSADPLEVIMLGALMLIAFTLADIYRLLEDSSK
jgi:hypothetical protein